MISQIISAAIGTVAFSLLFSVPKIYYPYCGFIGGIGWVIYCSLISIVSPAEATFFATIGVILLSRLFAVWERCPVTLFLIPGIFPLVPGAGVYWTSYYIVTGQLSQASVTGFEAIKVAVAIVLGIVLIFEVHQGVFTGIAKMAPMAWKNRRNERIKMLFIRKKKN